MTTDDKTKDRDLGDWRIEAVTTLEADLPAAYPGGPAHKAGEPLYVTNAARHRQYNVISFVTPAAAAMALNIAFKAAEEAQRLRQTFTLKDTVTPWGSGKMVQAAHLPQLYDFFEQCMIAVTFAFQALEVFSNLVISRLLTTNYDTEIRGKPASLTPEEVERILSTDEKLATVLPKLLKIDTPKGRKQWESFKKFKTARDATIHLKSKDARTKGPNVDEQTLFFHFFNTDPHDYARAALEMIDYFLSKTTALGSDVRWLRYAKEKIKVGV